MQRISGGQDDNENGYSKPANLAEEEALPGIMIMSEVVSVVKQYTYA